MTIKKGSLIRRLAQERREEPENAAGENNGGLALSLDGLLKKETPVSQVASELMAPSPESSPKVQASPIAPAASEPAAAPAPEAASEGKGSMESMETRSHAEPPAEKRVGAPRLGRVPGRQRRRHGDVCVRHPGEEKRIAGARAWLTPEESEKLELLATAYQISTSTLARDIILEGLAAHADLIEKTRRFLDSLGKGRASA